MTMARAKNSSGNGKVDVQKVEKIALVYNLVTKPSIYGANRRATTVTVRPATLAPVAAGFAGSNNRQPEVASWHGEPVTKELITNYIKEKKSQFIQETKKKYFS